MSDPAETPPAPPPENPSTPAGAPPSNDGGGVPEPVSPTHSGSISAPISTDQKGWLPPGAKRFAKLWGFFLFCILVVYWFRQVLLPFVFGLTVAYILAPAVDWLSSIKIGKRGMPRGVAVLLCYLILLSGMGVFFGAFLPRVAGDFQRLGSELPDFWKRLNTEWTPQFAEWIEKQAPDLFNKPEEPPRQPDPIGPSPFLKPPPGTVLTVTPLANGDYSIVVPEHGIEVERMDEKHFVLRPREDQPKKKLEELLRERLQKMVLGLEGQIDEILKFGQALVVGVISAIMQFVLVLMVAAFILVDLKRIREFSRGLIPRAYRVDYDRILVGVDRGLAGVIRGQLVICLVNGILTYIGLLIFKVKYALLLAAVAAIMSLIPIFGSILSSVPIVAIAMVSSENGIDIVKGALITGWILLIHFVEANFLNPNIIGSAAKMHPVLVIFALIAGEHSYGLVGALLAVPVASIIQTLFIYFRTQARGLPHPEAPAAK